MLPLLSRRGASLASRISTTTKSSINSITATTTTTSSRTSTTTSSTSRRSLAISAQLQAKRTALRAARKERAAQLVGQQQQQEASSGAVASSMSRYAWFWYGGALVIPSGLMIWAMYDDNSPPAQLSKWIGLTEWTQKMAKPVYDKLLPDWSQMPNVPHDIPPPHTLVLDLEGTLVGSTWDRKYGWRHAKRPGVDKFLEDMAQYYEIVLYSPSIDGVAEPVVNALDKERGCIMHRLYREATQNVDGIHVKVLDQLNRPTKRMIVLDDDPAEVQFNTENLIRVKPYTDPTDQSDNTLARITPFLIEIAREGYNDIPTLLRQYQGMDADEIADEQDRRLQRLKDQRQALREGGLGGFLAASRSGPMEPPELPPSTVSGFTSSSSSGSQLTAKDIAGSSPPPGLDGGGGLVGFLNRRAKEKEEHQQRKMEKWNEVMMKKHKAKEEAARQAAAQQ